jgi:hypothetical protein
MRSRLVPAVSGVACVLASMVLYAVLHVRPPTAGLDWTRRTISQYALMDGGWMFDAATLLLAAGSLLIVVALRGRLRTGATVALLLWVAGLVGVVWFEKHNWAAGPSISGDIHRAASLVAFLSLPVGALLTRAWPVRLGGVLSLLCFSPIVWAVLSESWTGVRWWQAIPLGAVERLVGLVEVLTVLALAGWAVAGGPHTRSDTQPASASRAAGEIR